MLVPFASSWHPVAVAWGVTALYLLLAVELTSLLRSRISKRVWRATHYLSFPLFALATIHGLSAGTDRHAMVLQAGVFAATAAIAGLTIVRADRADRRETARQQTRRRETTAASPPFGSALG